MRLIRATSRFFLGASTHGPGEGPFEVEAARAAELVGRGLAEYVASIDVPPPLQPPAPAPIAEGVDPAPAKAERAVSTRQRRKR